jgi:hypothetical protein
MNEKQIQSYIDNLVAFQLAGLKPDGSRLDEIDNIELSMEIIRFQNALRLIQSTRVKNKGSLECKMPLRLTPSGK